MTAVETPRRPDGARHVEQVVTDRRRRLWGPVVTVLLATSTIAAVAAWILVVRQEEPKGATTHADRFLETYVEADGRVVRQDQGGDTVSEGQAYAMLVAALVGDEERFRAVHRWSEDHLARPDALWAWRWRDGAVVDEMPASDADVIAAWALVVAGERFDDPRLGDAAVTIADAVIEHETVRVGGARHLAAGPWAIDDHTVVVNPGYAAFPAMARLADHTGDRRWSELAASSRNLLDRGTAAAHLPPDWVEIDRTTGDVRPIGGPDDPAAPARYGLEAARAVAWASLDCASDAPSAGWSHRLGEEPNAATRDPAGPPVGGTRHAAAGVAAALAAHRYDPEVFEARWGAAVTRDAARPSYYGAAWLALAEQLLRQRPPHICPHAT